MGKSAQFQPEVLVTINEVKTALIKASGNGYTSLKYRPKYERRGKVRDGCQYTESIRLIGGNTFRHDVYGTNEQGGWGGSADLSINYHLPGRFDPDGWEEVNL